MMMKEEEAEAPPPADAAVAVKDDDGGKRRRSPPPLPSSAAHSSHNDDNPSSSLFPLPSTASSSSSGALPPPPPPPNPSGSVQLRQRPAIPPKPQLDIVRFSMAQAKDEVDLDTILSELLELESQLSGEASDRLLLGLPALPSDKMQDRNKDRESSSRPSDGNADNNNMATMCAAPVEQMAKRVQFQSFMVENTDSHSSAASSSSSSASCSSGARVAVPLASSDACSSPDADSAFGDSSSTESGGQNHHQHNPANGYNNNDNGAQRVGAVQIRQHPPADDFRFRNSMNMLPSPAHTQAIPSAPSTNNGLSYDGGTRRPPSSAASFTSSAALDEQHKAAKIREALEKMKEAKMKKIFIQIFLEDGSKRGLLIDERWTVADTMRQLAYRFALPLFPEHAIVEEYPHLRIKRIYEDHERVIENLEDWTEESPNKLHFVRFAHKWDLFRHPQHFLVTDRNRAEFPEVGAEWNGPQKQRLLDTYLDTGSGNRVPELEGWLMLKADGKKCWRRHFFVLRSSGLYYVPKAGKPRGPTRDLQCLMSVFNNQVYTCTEWRKKYKAPPEYGFAIKHPRIQVKTSKYIKYICCEDESSYHQWVTALRITKNGCTVLFENFVAAQTQWHQSSGPSSPVRVEVPQVPLHRLSALEHSLAMFENRQTSSTVHSAASSSRSSPRHRVNGLGTLFHNHPQPSPMSSPMRTASSCLSGLAPSSRDCCDDSLATLRRNESPAVFFEQDDATANCNTIKRQPQYNNDRLAANKAQSVGVESDSDEEDQLPPPPPAMGPTTCPPWKCAPPPPARNVSTRLQTTQENVRTPNGRQNGAGSQMELMMAELQQRQRLRSMRQDQGT